MNATTDPGDRKVVFLRGINVGKSARIAMADLRDCTEAAGCADVKTVLATGNVVLTDPRPEAELRAVLEAAYADRFGYDAVVQVLTRGAVENAVTAYPFATLDDHHDYLIFCDDPDVTVAVAEAMRDAVDTDGTETVEAGRGCVYWRVPRGSTLNSPAAKATSDRSHEKHLTTRNLRTLRRILALG